MAYRLVPKTDQVKTAADAVAFIAADTGGAVVATGEVEEVRGGWKVQVYSTDGLNSNAIIGAASIAMNRGQLNNEEIERQIKMFGDQK